MAQYFVVCTNSAGDDVEDVATPDERNLITTVLEGKQWEVWHWFEDVWLVVNTSDQEQTASSLSREIRKKIDKQRYLLVMQVQPIDFAGFGPKLGWKWTRKNWPGHWDD